MIVGLSKSGGASSHNLRLQAKFAQSFVYIAVIRIKSIRTKDRKVVRRCQIPLQYLQLYLEAQNLVLKFLDALVCHRIPPRLHSELYATVQPVLRGYWAQRKINFEREM